MTSIEDTLILVESAKKRLRAEHNLPAIGVDDTFDNCCGTLFNAILSDSRKNDAKAKMNSADDACFYFTVSKWALAKVAYRFNSSFLRALADTEDSPIQTDALATLPHKAFWVSSSVRTEDNAGMLLYVEPCPGGCLVSCVLVNEDSRKGIGWRQCSLWLTNGQSVGEAMQEMLAAAGVGDIIGDGSFAKDRELVDEYTESIRLAIQCAYYLSAQNAEVKNVTAKKNSRPVRPDGTRFNIRKWDVGFRVGADFEKLCTTAAAASCAGCGGGEAKRPHVRRAHWHHFWTGKGRAVLVVRWLAPIAVNAETPDDISPIEHRVTGEMDTSTAGASRTNI